MQRLCESAPTQSRELTVGIGGYLRGRNTLTQRIQLLMPLFVCSLIEMENLTHSHYLVIVQPFFDFTSKFMRAWMTSTKLTQTDGFHIYVSQLTLKHKRAKLPRQTS